MKNISNRLEKLESSIKPQDEREDLTLLTDEELHRRIAELVCKDGSYNGYVFKSLSEYDGMTRDEQIQYINEVVEVMKPWFEETERKLEEEGLLCR